MNLGVNMMDPPWQTLVEFHVKMTATNHYTSIQGSWGPYMDWLRIAIAGEPWGRSGRRRSLSAL